MQLKRKVAAAMSGVVTYDQQILATAPIAYWPLNELTDTTAINYGTLGTAANGAYSGVTLAQVDAPGGGLAPTFDGLNDFCNIYTTAYRDAFSGAAGSFAIWYRVLDAGTWTDATARYLIRIYADGSNVIQLIKETTNNTMVASYSAGGTTEASSRSLSALTWLHFAMTWSKAAEQVIYYSNGATYETDINLGIWAGALTSIHQIVGAANTSASAPWKGHAAHAAIWTRALSPAEIATIYAGGL